MQKQTIDIKKAERMAWDVLANIADPEIPVLGLLDLGIVRQICIEENNITVTITPTYSGCPAMDMMGRQIKMELQAAGFKQVFIETILSPAWTTDWMSQAGKEKLKAYGIAPPTDKPSVCNHHLFAENEAIQCPQCNSYHTQRISEFGSTACKALYTCNDCKEPFDYFKCH